MVALAVLGSTGSIGENALQVVSAFPDRFRVVALAAGGGRLARLAEQVRQTGASWVAVPCREDADALRPSVGEGVRVVWGEKGLTEVATLPGVDTVVSAIVGAAGLVPTYAAVRAGKRVALANKETLVAAGELVMEAARRSGAAVLPVDSEHSALFQILEGRDPSQVKRLVLTASGGPFRGRRREELVSVGVDEALAHPRWSMGPKITVDSATLMNKGLEVIEARWLFGVPAERIDVVIHPESVVHSLVEFVDGSLLAQLATADMRGPIAYALGFPERLPLNGLGLDLTQVGRLTFEAPDREAFPCLDLAYRALAAGGTAPAALSAANEVAVAGFLEGKITFLQIPELVAAALEAHAPLPVESLEPVLRADRWARAFAREWIDRHGRRP